MENNFWLQVQFIINAIVNLMKSLMIPAINMTVWNVYIGLFAISVFLIAFKIIYTVSGGSR